MPGLKRAGKQWQGPCPNCGGTDRFRVLVDGKFFCRQCCPDGRDPQAMKAILAAAGLEASQANTPPRAEVTGLSDWW